MLKNTIIGIIYIVFVGKILQKQMMINKKIYFHSMIFAVILCREDRERVLPSLYLLEQETEKTMSY